MSNAPTSARVVVLGLALVMTACSQDRDVHYSTVYLPITIEVFDPGTATVIWKMDVPVQHKLIMDFNRTDDIEFAGVDPDKPATSFRWSLIRTRGGKRVDHGRVQLQGVPVLKRISYRPAPEYPAHYTPPSASEAIGVEPEAKPEVKREDTAEVTEDVEIEVEEIIEPDVEIEVELEEEDLVK